MFIKSIFIKDLRLTGAEKFKDWKIRNAPGKWAFCPDLLTLEIQLKFFNS